MCKIGDIIVVDKYIGDDGATIGRHSFVVISTDKGKIEGLDYDLVTNALSSFKNEEHEKKVMSKEGNLKVTSTDKSFVTGHNNTNGFIKAKCLVYFRKNNINYFTLGSLSVEMWEKLEDILLELNEADKLVDNINNLQETDN